MRKLALGISVLLMAVSARAQAPMDATDITAAQVQAFIKDAPRDRNSDRPIRVIDVGGYHVGLFGVFRPKDAPITATVHQTDATETYYILDGAGVLVTGGTLKKPTTPRLRVLEQRLALFPLHPERTQVESREVTPDQYESCCVHGWVRVAFGRGKSLTS